MRAVSLVIFVAILLVPACSSGPTPIKVSGKVNFGGQPLKSTEGYTIMFNPVVEKGQQFTSEVASPLSEDGSFTVPGKNGKGIAPGKYKVTINQMSGGPVNDMFSAEKTQLVFDITGDTSLTIDLSKPTGK